MTTESVEDIVSDLPSGDLQVIARAAALLRLFTPSHRTIKLNAAADALGLRRSTTHRYLASLENHGFLKRVDGTSYTLGPLVAQLGTLATGRLRVVEAAAPLMQELAAQARQTAVLSVWGGLGPVIARVHEDTSRVVHVSVQLGATLPFESAQGMVFLANMRDSRVVRRLLATLPEDRMAEFDRQLDRARSDGLVVSDRVVDGVRTLAVPILDADDDVCAALALVGTLNSMSEESHSGLAQALVATGRRLSEMVRGANGTDVR